MDITIKFQGYVMCQSSFYSVQDLVSSEKTYSFTSGINKIEGEIDSGIWAVSYLLSMYNYKKDSFMIFDYPEIFVDNKPVAIDEISEISCYLDKSYPLFSSKEAVKDLLINGLNHSKVLYSIDDVIDMFQLDSERILRPLSGVGNEIYRAMAAIGLAYGKEVFCFPWMSYKRFSGYHNNTAKLLDILKELNKVIILPIGYNV